MSMQGGAIAEHFLSITDPRVDRNKEHELLNIITIAICAVICGAEGWVDVEEYGEAMQGWFETFLELPNGIPSHDTFGRVFAAIDSEEFERSFASWVQSIVTLAVGEIVAIDGKTNRRSHNKKIGKDAIHLVSAFAHDNGITLGQKAVDKKSNELKAIPKLLKILNISGCIVTIDAAGCYREVVNAIVKKKADYVIAVKKNQPTLYQDIERLFAEQTDDDEPDASIAEKSHGREEQRACWMITDEDQLETIHNKKQWKHLSSIVKVTNTRTVNEQTSTESRYYISSVQTTDAHKILSAVRQHWSIENNLHWSLDLTFREDDSRMRIKNSQQNFSLIRKMAFNLIKQENSTKKSLRLRRKLAGWDHGYLLKILGV